MFSKINARFALLVLVAALCASICHADTMAPRVFVAREGKGYLEKVGPQMVLHLKGTPEEMGCQYGVLLKNEINSMVKLLEQNSENKLGALSGVGQSMLDTAWNQQQAYMPPRYTSELKALARSCGISYERLRRANTIPELFHCSGFAIFGGATTDGKLYHGRILDYGLGLGFQDHSVVIIAEPSGFNAYVNVSYAGFTGSVTGMNMNGMGFGEMGGGGVGKWDGLPMSFLMRRGLEEAKTLSQAKNIFSKSKRTCEYYYVISDGNTPSAVGVSAKPEAIEFLDPNESRGPLHVAIKDAVVMSASDRYELLTKRITENWGKLDAAKCRELMRRPVSMQSCLHCVLMAPKTGEMWVAHASSKGEPASEQPYVYLNIKELMAKKP